MNPTYEMVDFLINGVTQPLLVRLLGGTYEIDFEFELHMPLLHISDDISLNGKKYYYLFLSLSTKKPEPPIYNDEPVFTQKHLLNFFYDSDYDSY